LIGSWWETDGEVDESFDNWTVQLRKGLLELCVLAAIGGGERYGYELVRALVAARGLEVAEGSIYPLLSRMRKQGLVATRLEESPEGPARKYYRLTTAGRARLAAMRIHYDSLVAAVAALRSESDP
jgi:PadR family transcriptional regulator, regulatory protein PadR